ncbi:MAG: hypothetical protein K8R59_10045 [Thermoanaerobaculales bacterium]|nr:hypothetical protein [Thermoanaerobaculales bacterium]
MIRHQTPQHLLEGLKPPNPPPDLRDRCIAAARATRAKDQRTEVWSRLWANPSARWAWATTVATLLLAHAAISITPTPPSTGSPFLVAGGIPDNDLADLVDLLPLRPDCLPLLGSDPGPLEFNDEMNPERS